MFNPSDPPALICTCTSSPAMDSPPTTPSSTSSAHFSHSHSHRDSISTISTTISSIPSLDEEAKTTISAAIEAAKLDPLSRTFPKPACTATIDEMLARTPGKWSLKHYVKNMKEVRTPAVDKEVRARQFAEAKAELLRAKRDMDLGGRR